MNYDTENILDKLIDKLSEMNEVQSIGISGSITPLPQAGEGDIDIFIYCDSIPDKEKRQAIIDFMGEQIQESKINVFEEGHWGTGDFALINDIETWLMYFSVSETLTNVEAILNGEYPDKLDNYYYPVGRCAMFKNINIMYDRSDFLYNLKRKLSHFPIELSNMLIQYHLEELDDLEDLQRAVERKDVLFYHFAMDNAIDHFLQALFAINKTFFPSRKRTLEYIEKFNIKPYECDKKLLDVIRLGSCSEGINESYSLWINLVNELKNLDNHI